VTALLGSFALLAFVLSTVGLYGVISYTTSQRTRELGVRLALGARSIDVLQLVLGDGLRMAVIGLGIGLAGAYLATRALRTMLFSVQPGDPWTLAFVALGIIVTAAAASYVPARRATRIDPLRALRAE
jgi:putative ABC transport system permease protein